MKILHAKYLEDYKIQVKFDDGTLKICDLTHFVKTHDVLINTHFFKNFKVDSGGYGLVWSDDLDVAESHLFEIGKIITE